MKHREGRTEVERIWVEEDAKRCAREQDTIGFLTHFHARLRAVG